MRLSFVRSGHRGRFEKLKNIYFEKLFLYVPFIETRLDNKGRIFSTNETGSLKMPGLDEYGDVVAI